MKKTITPLQVLITTISMIVYMYIYFYTENLWIKTAVGFAVIFIVSLVIKHLPSEDFIEETVKVINDKNLTTEEKVEHLEHTAKYLLERANDIYLGAEVYIPTESTPEITIASKDEHPLGIMGENNMVHFVGSNHLAINTSAKDMCSTSMKKPKKSKKVKQHCPYCHVTLEGDEVFCHWCGTKLEEIEK